MKQLLRQISVICIFFVTISCQNLHEDSIISKSKLFQITDFEIFQKSNMNVDSIFESEEMDSFQGKLIADLQAIEWESSSELIYVENNGFTIRGSFTTTSDESQNLFFISQWFYIYKNSKNIDCLAVVVGNKGIKNAGIFKCTKGILNTWPKITKWSIEPFKDIPGTYSSYSLINLNNIITWKCFDNSIGGRYIYYDANNGDKIVIKENNRPSLFSCLNEK